MSFFIGILIGLTAGYFIWVKTSSLREDRLKEVVKVLLKKLEEKK